MYLDYLNEFVSYIHNTSLIIGRERQVTDYNEKMGLLVDFFSEIKQEGKQVFFIGNGGSAAIASHMTADFMKNGGMKTYSLYDSAVTTCMANDYGYEAIFAKPLEFLANKGDLLVAISSSGNSLNILKAIEAAHTRGAKVLTFTGFLEDNKAKAMGDYNVYVPVEDYGRVESIHNFILQQIVDTILQRDGAVL